VNDHPMESTTVLVAGATGMLGGSIAAELSGLPHVDLRLLARAGSQHDPSKRARLDALVARGARIVDGDLAEPASLKAATAGVDVVISAVQGGRTIIVDGQVALAHAAADNGVRRILPSDFALDVFKSPPGEHAFFDLRREADEAIAATGLEHVHVLSGAFMDGFVTRSLITSAERRPSGAVGPRRSMRRLRPTPHGTRHSLGTVDDLRQAIVETRRLDPDPAAPAMLVYLLFMLTGQTALEDLQNDRYPDVHPEQFTSVARRLLGAPPYSRNGLIAAVQSRLTEERQ
jgi:uncharacterized protein YbjT (DUF2867 family)